MNCYNLFKSVIVLSIILVFNSCYICHTHYDDIKEVKTPLSVKMYIGDYDSDDRFSPSFSYDIGKTDTLEDISVTFLNEENDTIKYHTSYIYLADDSSGHSNDFKSIKREYKNPKTKRGYVEYILESYIGNEEFTVIVYSSILSGGVITNHENKYKVIKNTSCHLGFPIH